MRGKKFWGPMALGVVIAAGAAAPASAQIAQPPGAIKNVELVHNIPEASAATAINFMTYGN